MDLNFVVSSNLYSHVFNAIFGYFKKYLPRHTRLYISEKPKAKMDVYHYHRPQLEDKLLSNSVVTVHQDLNEITPWFSINHCIARYREARHIICLNTSQAKILRAHGLNHITVIPHGVNTEYLKKTHRTLREAKLVIGIISKRYQRRVKGETYLFELYKRLDPRLFEFCFIGEGRDVDRRITSQFGYDAIAYETLPYPFFNALYAYLDILLIPSFYEGGPASLPEALETGTPVIGNQVGMLSDYIEPGKNGYFLSGCPDSDAKLLLALAKNTDNIFSNLLQVINRDSSKVLSWQAVVEAHLTVYKKKVLENA